jgi:hypothetical protein
MGFERRPQTEWFTDDGSFAGIVHQERNWTYVLVRGAGHQLPPWDPVAVRPFFIHPKSLSTLRYHVRPMFFCASSSWARTRLGSTSTVDRRRRLRGPRPHSRVQPTTCSVVETPFSPARTLRRVRWSHLLRRSQHGTVSSPLAGAQHLSRARRKHHAPGRVSD